jgi:hypothetical protein
MWLPLVVFDKDFAGWLSEVTALRRGADAKTRLKSTPEFYPLMRTVNSDSANGVV